MSLKYEKSIGLNNMVRLNMDIMQLWVVMVNIIATMI